MGGLQDIVENTMRRHKDRRRHERRPASEDTSGPR